MTEYDRMYLVGFGVCVLIGIVGAMIMRVLFGPSI
jgi:hypothetical protein